MRPTLAGETSRFSAHLRSFVIAGTALLAAGTLAVRGNSCGHDFDFHLLSWMEVARAWHGGLLYPHWVQDANFGAGEPRLIFYPPASWLLGGLLGTISGWHAAPVLFVLLALLGAGCGMYFLAREWAPPGAASFAACLYIANPYAMFVAYERSALGELLAGAWLPWMVLFALRRRSSIAPLGLAVASLWLSNSPAAVMGSYMLAVLGSVLWIVEGRPWPALRAAGGMALGLGMAAFYIVPAAFEQRWVQIERAIIPGIRVQDSFLFGHTADAFHDQVLHTASWIFVAELAAASIAAWVAWRRQAGGQARIALTTLLPLILLLQLPFSDVIWKHAPHLKFLQFPWRWLLPLSVVGCVLAGMAMGKIRGIPAFAKIAKDPEFPTARPHPVQRVRLLIRKAAGPLWTPPSHIGNPGPGAPGRLFVGNDLNIGPTLGMAFDLGVLIVFLAIGGGLFFFQPCDDEDAVGAQVAAFRLGQGTQGTDEYTPSGADNSAVQQHLPPVRVLRGAQDDTADSTQGDNPEWRAGNASIPARVDSRRWNEEHWLIHVDTPQDGYAVLRLMDYPSWQVTVDSKAVPARPARNDGLMAVPVTEGSHTIEVRWTATGDIVAGRTISIVALLGLIVVAKLERRERRL